MKTDLKRKQAALVATLGTEPQVVTAVLDLLLKQGEDICKVRIIHTTFPDSGIEQALTALKNTGIRQFYQELDFQFIPVVTKNGELVPDVSTSLESAAAFQGLYNQIRELKNTGCRVHLSIAGGRKTMAVFGMVAAQLLFDEHDRLWHLYSGGDFLKNRWLHPNPDDDVHLIPIPVVQWSNVAPILLDFSEIQDPVEALSHQQALRIKHRLEDIRSFVLGSLSPAEERVVALLVKTGLSDNELAEELFLSPRTVEQHLRSAYRKASDHWGLSVVGRAQLITLLNLYYSTQITGNPA